MNDKFSTTHLLEIIDILENKENSIKNYLFEKCIHAINDVLYLKCCSIMPLAKPLMFSDISLRTRVKINGTIMNATK